MVDWLFGNRSTTTRKTSIVYLLYSNRQANKLTTKTMSDRNCHVLVLLSCFSASCHSPIHPPDVPTSFRSYVSPSLPGLSASLFLPTLKFTYPQYLPVSRLSAFRLHIFTFWQFDLAHAACFFFWHTYNTSHFISSTYHFQTFELLYIKCVYIVVVITCLRDHMCNIY